MAKPHFNPIEAIAEQVRSRWSAAVAKLENDLVLATKAADPATRTRYLDRALTALTEMHALATRLEEQIKKLQGHLL
jgi:hypothetical protein